MQSLDHFLQELLSNLKVFFEILVIQVKLLNSILTISFSLSWHIQCDTKEDAFIDNTDERISIIFMKLYT